MCRSIPVEHGRGVRGGVGVAELDAARTAARPSRGRAGAARCRRRVRRPPAARPSPRSTGRSRSPTPGSSPAGSRSTPPASAAPAPWTGRRPACPPTARRPRPGRVPSTSAAPMASSGSVDDDAPRWSASSRALRSSVPRSRPRQLAEGARLAAVPAEALDDPDAEHALLDDRRQIADLVLGACARPARTASRRASRGSSAARRGRAAPAPASSPGPAGWRSRPGSSTALTSRKVSGKARNIRSSIRSVVPRDSSWPEAQRSWKATGSRCRCR